MLRFRAKNFQQLTSPLWECTKFTDIILIEKMHTNRLKLCLKHVFVCFVFFPLQTILIVMRAQLVESRANFVCKTRSRFCCANSLGIHVTSITELAYRQKYANERNFAAMIRENRDADRFTDKT